MDHVSTFTTEVTEVLSNRFFPDFVTLDSSHRPQNMARNEAADLQGGYGPRSLAGFSPGRVNFSPRASAAEDSKDQMLLLFYFRKINQNFSNATVSTGF